MTGDGRLRIQGLWDGTAAREEEWAEVTAIPDGAGLAVDIRAGYHGDPRPPKPAGPCEGLWEFEVVELFLANRHGRYLELEFGPHGHYLALGFAGIRRRMAGEIILHYQADIDGSTWQGRAWVPKAALPPGPGLLVNAYAIHGVGPARRYLAAFPVPGTRPDFHQPRYFRPWPEGEALG